jgi:hypothetical protein
MMVNHYFKKLFKILNQKLIPLFDINYIIIIGKVKFKFGIYRLILLLGFIILLFKIMIIGKLIIKNIQLLLNLFRSIPI